MILQRLVEYAQRVNEAPTMYKMTPIPWVINLDATGKFKSIIDVRGEGKKDKGKEILLPTPGVRASGIKANLLADKAEYVLGVPREEPDPKTPSRHQAFVELVHKCQDATGETSVEAVAEFLDTLDLGKILSDPNAKELTAEAWVAFQVEGRFPAQLPSVLEFWARENMGGENKTRENEGFYCVICGSACQPVTPHPINIKGVPQGQSSGLALISANENAFESYGLEKSLIAPTCGKCAEQYATALNLLLKNEDTHLNIGPLAYVYWTRGESGFSITRLLSQPDPNDVKALLEGPFHGRENKALDAEAFYSLTISASSARIAVRDLLVTTIGHARENLTRWFELQKLVESDGSEGAPKGIFALAASVYRDAVKEMVPNVPRALLHVAIQGGTLPDWLLYQAIKRNRAGRGGRDNTFIPRTRAILIKMLLALKDEQFGGEALIKMDPNNTNPAYLCGRLLAELEAIQRMAIPGVKSTIVDRFYGTASSAPAVVFGRLLHDVQNHLAKLRKERPGMHEIFQQELSSIQEKLSGFPKTLTLEEQGLFALGYYHQVAANRAAAKSRKEGSAAMSEETAI